MTRAPAGAGVILKRAMATEPSHPAPTLSLAQLTVHDAEGDLLDVDPLDLGPDALGKKPQ